MGKEVTWVQHPDGKESQTTTIFTRFFGDINFFSYLCVKITLYEQPTARATQTA